MAAPSPSLEGCFVKLGRANKHRHEFAAVLGQSTRLYTKALYSAGAAAVINPRVGGCHGDLAQALALAVSNHNKGGVRILSSHRPPEHWPDPPSRGLSYAERRYPQHSQRMRELAHTAALLGVPLLQQPPMKAISGPFRFSYTRGVLGERLSGAGSQ